MYKKIQNIWGETFRKCPCWERYRGKDKVSEREKPWSEDGNQVEQYVRSQRKGFWRSQWINSKIRGRRTWKTEHCILGLTKKLLVSFTYFCFIFNGAHKAASLLRAFVHNPGLLMTLAYNLSFGWPCPMFSFPSFSLSPMKAFHPLVDFIFQFKIIQRSLGRIT